VRDSAGQVIIETEQASLTDAIQACDLRDSLIVRRGDIDSVRVDSGVIIWESENHSPVASLVVAPLSGTADTNFQFDAAETTTNLPDRPGGSRL
jgi:hypothetical protein